MGREPILVEQDTCWRIARAGRVGFLVDGADYFAALASAIERAEHSVLMVGWDFHSRIRLRRDSGEGSEELAEFLDSVVSRRPSLHVRILEWDFAVLYALERESLHLLRFGFRTGRRVHFHFDDAHPIGASHHQKIIVVDGALAFSGGLDVAACRWDTREHRGSDPRRSDPGYPDYGPFHDVQIAVDGDAAAALDELARERWRRATGETLAPLPGSSDPWPEVLAPDLRDVDVGIARTDPAFDGRSEVREVERLHVASIEAAERWIYLENQYLTADVVGTALAGRLGEEDGPEVVIVSPVRCYGWLEEGSMGVLRARLLRRLRDADRFGRLRVLYPVVPDLGDGKYTLHSKVSIVDERLLRIGSANLSNRSMGLDTECDVAIEAGGEDRVERAIADFRDGLLAEHLGVSVPDVAAALAERGSLAGAVDALAGGPRTLAPLEADVPEWLDELVPESAVVDPERPVGLDELVERLLPEDLDEEKRRPLLARIGLGVAVLAGLAVLWRFTPVGDLVTPDAILGLADPLREGSAGPWLGAGIFAVAATLLVPVTALTVASALLFGWASGFATALGGSLLGALAGYGIGAVLWREAVRRLAGKRLNRLSRRLARRGALAVAAVRIVPVAPFGVVNMVAGASHIGVRDFAAGTLLGMGPGTLLLCLFSHKAVEAVSDPGLGTLASALGLALLLVVVTLWLRRRILGSQREPARPPGGGR